MGKALELNNANFENEVIKSDKPVLVDFWAEWCMPCRMMTPVVEELAKDYEGEIKVGKVNVDDNQALAAQFRIQGIPALFVFHNGQIVDRMVGAQPKAAIESRLKALMAAK